MVDFATSECPSDHVVSDVMHGLRIPYTLQADEWHHNHSKKYYLSEGESYSSQKTE